VPFTRAGCDVGAFSLANLEFENVTSDITNVFGAGSPQAMEASSNPTKATADFEGIIVHCAQGSALCAKNGAPDLLPDEPGGYNGFQALYGNVNVAPAINHGAPSVNDLDGNVIADSHGNPGFPGFDPRPAQSLGYVATMLEAGVPVVYFYIEDAHDNDPALSGVPSSTEQTFGPGEQGYVTGLKAYDKAFGQFFARLAKDGITKDNTLFVVTADENDHFVGGPPSPTTCDGINVSCTYAKKGEIDADLSLVYATEFGNTTPFRVHSDDAPTVYINGDPTAQTDATTRTLEQQAGAMLGFDPVANNGAGATNHVSANMVDHAEQAFLHMITFDPNRTPNFIIFGNDDYFLSASGKTSPLCTPPRNAASCFVEESGFAWNHGDFQNQITRTWLGMAGPGIEHLGRFDGIFSDHTDVRPTIMSLVGLTDDYSHDGRVLTEVIKQDALPQSLRQRQDLVSALGQAYKQINAPHGELGRKTLRLSTDGLAGNNAIYNLSEATINQMTAKRNAIAGKMIDMIEAAEFDDTPIDEFQATQLIAQANILLALVP
jgi:arylsulfatase A-like enzyme